jgi:hypothetical protein
MPSSISSFELTAVLKTLGTTLVIILVVWLVTPRSFVFDEQPVPGAGPLNELIVEQYIHERQDKPIVFVGSSVQTMVPPPHCRPDNVATIYIQGGGPMSGLETLRRTGARPKVVFIEVSTLLRGVDDDLMKAVFMPVYWRIRSVISPLRHERNWLVLLFRSRLYKRSPPRFTLEEPTESVDEWRQLMAPRSVPLVAQNDDRTIALVLPDVVSRVRELQQQGTQVIFYDPMDPELAALAPNKDVRLALRAALPDVEIIEAPDDEFPIYRWDRMHVVDASGLRLFEYLMRREGLPIQKKCELLSRRSPS